MADPKENQPAPDLFAQLAAQARELLTHLSHYLAVQVDSARLMTMRFVRSVCIALALAMFFGGMLACAGYFVVSGIALGLAGLFDSIWIGRVAGGSLTLAFLCGGVFLGLRFLDAKRLRRARQRHEQRTPPQRSVAPDRG